MDDINEQMTTANEVADAISRPMGGSALFDDDELAAELDALVQEDLDEKLLGTGLGALPAIPSVPTTAIPGKQKIYEWRQGEREDNGGHVLSDTSHLIPYPLSNSLHIFIFTAIAQPPRPTKAQTVDDDEDAELAQLRAEMAL